MTQHGRVGRRAEIVAAARKWIGTPYRRQGSEIGAGCDCLGLVRGVWREIVGPEPEAIGPYRPDWDEWDPQERLGRGMARWMKPSPNPLPGDVLLFRMAPGASLKHAAILTADHSIVHAYWARAVVESRWGPWWARRLGAAYSFPEADEWRS